MKKFSPSLMNHIARKRRDEEHKRGLIVVNENVIADRDKAIGEYRAALSMAGKRIAELERQQRQQSALVTNERRTLTVNAERIEELEIQVAVARDHAARLGELVANSAETRLRDAIWRGDDVALMEALASLFFTTRAPVFNAIGILPPKLVLWGTPLPEANKRRAIVTDANGERLGSVTANSNDAGTVESVTVENHGEFLNIPIANALTPQQPEPMKGLTVERNDKTTVVNCGMTSTERVEISAPKIVLKIDQITLQMPEMPPAPPPPTIPEPPPIAPLPPTVKRVTFERDYTGRITGATVEETP